MRRSSTSSSDRAAWPEGFPWAGVAAAVLVCLLDLAVFGRAWPWVALERAFPSQHLLAAGVASDHRQLAALETAPRGVARVALIGSSRLQAVLTAEPVARDLGAEGSVAVAELAHAGVEPFGVLALSDRLADLGVDVVLVQLSEFDTHRPPEARAAAVVGSPAAVGELLASLGPLTGWRSRPWLERLALASVFAAYRHREVALAFGLSELRTFANARRPRRAGARGGADFATPSQEWPDLDVRRRLQIEAELPEESAQRRASERRRIRSITRGPHVEAQMRLVLAAVERLREAGIRVVLLEGPLSPAAAELYDVSTRREFQQFARGLAARPGVRFVPLGERYYEEDFVDYSHASARGAAKLARSIEAAVRAAPGDQP